MFLLSRLVLFPRRLSLSCILLSFDCVNSSRLSPSSWRSRILGSARSLVLFVAAAASRRASCRGVSYVVSFLGVCVSSCRPVVLLVVSCGLLVRASRAVPFRGGAVCGGDVLLVRFARLVVVPFALSSVLPVSFLSSSSSGMAMRDLCVGGLIRSSRGVWRSSCSGGRGCDFVSAALGSS